MTGKIINILRYTGNDLIERNLTKFVEIIFNNFDDISNQPELNHNKREILRLLTSPNSICIIATYKGQIIGYLIAEITSVDNFGQLMHISYIFTSPMHRNKGVASYMLNKIQSYAEELNINTLSLTFDTYDKSLERFYLNNNFVYDDNLRSHQRHDMLVKYI